MNHLTSDPKPLLHAYFLLATLPLQHKTYSVRIQSNGPLECRSFGNFILKIHRATMDSLTVLSSAVRKGHTVVCKSHIGKFVEQF